MENDSWFFVVQLTFGVLQLAYLLLSGAVITSGSVTCKVTNTTLWQNHFLISICNFSHFLSVLSMSTHLCIPSPVSYCRLYTFFSSLCLLASLCSWECWGAWSSVSFCYSIQAECCGPVSATQQTNILHTFYFSYLLLCLVVICFIKEHQKSSLYCSFHFSTFHTVCACLVITAMPTCCFLHPLLLFLSLLFCLLCLLIWVFFPSPIFLSSAFLYFPLPALHIYFLSFLFTFSTLLHQLDKLISSHFHPTYKINWILYFHTLIGIYVFSRVQGI